MVFGFVGTQFRNIKYPLIVGYMIYTAGIAALATINPGDNSSSIGFACLAGLGFGGPLILIFSGVQLSVPHALLATASAVTTSARSVGATVFTAIYSTIVSSNLGKDIPTYVSKAAMTAGLPPSSIGPFIGALTSMNPPDALKQVPGVNATIIQAGEAALKHAYANGLRDVFIIGASLGGLGIFLCFFLGDVKKTMNYHVDAAMEKRALTGVENQHIEDVSN